MPPGVVLELVGSGTICTMVGVSGVSGVSDVGVKVVGAGCTAQFGLIDPQALNLAGAMRC